MLKRTLYVLAVFAVTLCMVFGTTGCCCSSLGDLLEDVTASQTSALDTTYDDDDYSSYDDDDDYGSYDDDDDYGSLSSSYDYLITGSWELNAISDEGEIEFTYIDSEAYFYSSHTGYIEVDDSTLYFSWKYVYSDGDTRLFQLTTTDGSVIYASTSGAVSSSLYDTLVVMLEGDADGYVLFFER